MKVLVIVNESPWGATLPVAALRLVRAMISGGCTIDAVYFRGDGVYNAQAGRATDAGTPDLARTWAALSKKADFPLLLCKAAATRRFDFVPEGGFREAGLAEIFERMQASDRVVSF